MCDNPHHVYLDPACADGARQQDPREPDASLLANAPDTIDIEPRTREWPEVHPLLDGPLYSRGPHGDARAHDRWELEIWLARLATCDGEIARLGSVRQHIMSRAATLRERLGQWEP